MNGWEMKPDELLVKKLYCSITIWQSIRKDHNSPHKFRIPQVFEAVYMPFKNPVSGSIDELIINFCQFHI